MRPLVNLLRPGLDRFLPFAGASNQGDSQWRQRPHDLRSGNLLPILDHQQVNQVVAIGQRVAFPRIDAYRTIDATGLNLLADRRNMTGIAR